MKSFELITTSYENSKKLNDDIMQKYGSQYTFGWFGHPERKDQDTGELWIWVNTIIPFNNQDKDHRIDICCNVEICPAYTVRDLLKEIEKRDKGEALNTAIQRRLNQGNHLTSFISDPNFYAEILLKS